MGKKTHDEFIMELTKLNPNIIPIELYNGANNHITFKCLIDDNEWIATPHNILRGTGCPICARKSQIIKQSKSHEQFIEEIEVIHPNIKILSKYSKAKDKIKCLCSIDNYQWEASASSLLTGRGCPLCKKINIRLKSRKSNEDFLKEVYSINNNIIILENYINSSNRILCMCKLCHYEWKARPQSLLEGRKCPVCSNTIVKSGINDIATTHPEYVKYFKNSIDATKYTMGSGKYVDMNCPACNKVKSMKISNLFNFGFNCDYCSDGISYPNKFGRSLLLQLPIETLIPEYSPTWANGKKYDNYFEYNGNKYILEMDGDWHYKDNLLSKKTAEEAMAIDKFKDELAKKHNIEVIRIDSRISNKEYIKHNILNSKLNNIICLDKVNWDKCELDANNSILFEICDFYNNNKSMSVRQMVKHLNYCSDTIFKYLKKGRDVGLCDYESNYGKKKKEK